MKKIPDRLQETWPSRRRRRREDGGWSRLQQTIRTPEKMVIRVPTAGLFGNYWSRNFTGTVPRTWPSLWSHVSCSVEPLVMTKVLVTAKNHKSNMFHDTDSCYLGLTSGRPCRNTNWASDHRALASLAWLAINFGLLSTRRSHNNAA